MSEDLGAVLTGNGRCRFRVWAPFSERVHLRIISPAESLVCMEPKNFGYHAATVENIPPGARYRYRLSNGNEFPDPASRYQPDGVHGPSEVIDSRFDWHDQRWFGLPIEKYIIYELHVGAFTSRSTFDAVIPHLDHLVDVGVTAVELMPVAQFPGNRNWGYDGAYPFAVQNSYGGAAGLKRLVDACHARGLAAILDVVYNHLGPEGNYLPQFGPYFTDRYRTPWGAAINFDDAHSDQVRHFFVSNAIEWIRDYHFDALRLDAVHAIFDYSALNILEEISAAVHEQAAVLNRRVYVIAESALNDSRVIRPVALGGYGIDAQWNDDFHHSLHALLTREREGYYSDFGEFRHLAQAFSEGFVYSGCYSAVRRRRHGNSSMDIPSARFVVFAQNHDQVGNRMMGERLNGLVSFEGCKLAAGIVFLSPFVPLMFMGDEYGEKAPFQYFVSHSDPQLVEGVRRGRKEEFSSFQWYAEPPDPQDESTFHRSMLNHSLTGDRRHRTILEFHKELLALRKSIAALYCLSKDKMDVIGSEAERILAVRRWNENSEVFTIFNFNDDEARFCQKIPCGTWRKRLDSSEPRWMGSGPAVSESLDGSQICNMTLQPYGVLLFEKQIEE